MTLARENDRPCAIIVTGGRRYAAGAYLAATLDRLRERRNLVLVLHGGCSGADALAGVWAASRGVPCETYAAAWEHMGKQAGPYRNGLMVERLVGLRSTHRVGVVCFPGASGTEDCARQAAREGIGVWRR